MAYVFDPINNTLIDDEDKSLGNKFALNDEEFQKLLDIPGVFRASEAPQPPPRQEVLDREAINRFMKDNKAEGGRINQQFGTNVMTLNPLFPKKDPTDFGSFKPLDVPGMALPVGATLGGMRLKDIFFSKDKGDDKKNIQQSDDKNNIIPPEFDPKDPRFVENVIEGALTLKEIRDTFEKSKQLYDQKKMSEVVEVTNKEFAQKLANFVDKKYQGNVNALAKDILGVTEKTQDVDNLRARINSLFKNRGIDRGKRLGNIAPSNLNFETDTPKTSWSDFTTKVSQEPGYIKSLTKPLLKQGLIDKSQYLPQNDLEKIFAIEHTGSKEQIKTKRSNMGFIIGNLSKDGSIRKRKLGLFTSYHLGDVMKALQLKYGEGGKKIYGVVKKGSPRKYKEIKSFDESLFSIINNFQRSFEDAAKIEGLTEKKPTGKEGIINKASPDHSHAEARSTMLKFPNVFKNSNLKTFQTITLTDPLFNQEIINKGGFEAKRIKIYRTLNNYIGKKVTPEIQEILTEQKTKLNNINNEILVAAEKAGLQGVEETFIPIDINIPNVGEKFKSENVFGDTSGKNIMGDVDEINSNAKVYNDLSKEEKLVYRENLINEYIDYFKDFYKRAEFDDDDIASFIDRILEGDPAGKMLPIGEKKLPKKSGGGVEITPLPRTNFGNGGAAGADDNFLKELEFYFTNEDAELPKLQTYKETMNPVEVLNDIIDPRNYPYYADVLARSGLRIGEFAVRVLPATGKLVADAIQKGPFKVTGTGSNYVQDYTDVVPSNIEGTGIFSEFLKNITPTATEKFVGLDKLIEKEEQKQIERGSTAGPKVFADTIGLGAEVTAPIFPGLKLLNSFAKARNLPNDKATQKILEEEVDKVLSDKGMSRREFLQMTGASATVVMAKMLGLMDIAPKAAKVVRAAPIMDNTVEGMPAWFKEAVYAIERKGLLKSRGDIKGIEPDFFEITLNTKLGPKRVLMSKNDRTGEITLDWTTDYYDTELPVTITYKPGQSGKQNFLSDPEFPQSVEKYDVEVEAPEFEYKTVDVESMGPEDTSFDSSINLNIKEEADAVVEALEELGLGLTKKQKKDAAENFRYYNEVELDESSVGPDTANPIDESDAYTFLDMIKRNRDK